MPVPRTAGAALAAAVLAASAPPAAADPAASPPPAPAPGGGAEAPAAAATSAAPAGSDKSIAFYVGRNLTADGSVLVGGFGHEPSSHWLEIVDRQEHPEDATVTVGATGEALIPGRLTEIPQAERTAKYITMNYSEFAGFPAPLTNGGLNEHQVAARDVWSDSRPELVEMTPTPQEGPQYSDLSRLAMERATSAREAVEIVGGLIDEYGYTTYGGNSHLFADENEGWVLVEFAGGQGLWAAERLGPDDVRVSYPGYITDFPVDYADDPDFMGSPNLVDFAEERGWFDSEGRDTINLQEVYGTPFPGPPGDDADAPFRYPPRLEDELRAMAPMRLEDMLRMVRDPRWSDDRSGYGQVARLRGGLPHRDLASLWVAPTAAVTAPYIPWHIGAEGVPPEYSQHRYLTADAASTYVDPDHAHLEATRYPVRIFKRLMYYTCEHPEEFLGEVTAALEGFEAQTLAQLEDVEAEAAASYAAGDAAEAREALTDFSSERAMAALDLGEHLVEDVERRTKEKWGIRMPTQEPPEGVTARAESLDPNLTGEGVVTARDRVNCDMGNGWADGSTVDRQGDYGDPADIPDYTTAGAGADGTGGEGTTVPWLWAAAGAAAGLLVGALSMTWLPARRRQTAETPAEDSGE
ncbi:C69 family dipeptidase [Streptomonospora sp. S1-112]|uniref:C69 family dipeptidase n=1 Tax=Streptomonospora mangrovi TaxID=2883123 RepID=A0A9X3SI67_9ACTN|nr:C69 family dipeptidase [Streptomonospora mangrovi]MDA0567915.1 C69 family dipeptidase [Streptomonospora mangrovi]